MEKICLKDGKEVVFREASQEDAEKMIKFYNEVGGETDFLSFGKNEFIKEISAYKTNIDGVKGEVNSIIVLVTAEDQIIAIASIHSNQKARTKHVGTLGIVIGKQYWGLGLGRKLMDYLIEWSKSNGVTKKISLITNENNNIAIGLYKQIGFGVEGLIRNDNYINGVFNNTIIMGLLL